MAPLLWFLLSGCNALNQTECSEHWVSLTFSMVYFIVCAEDSTKSWSVFYDRKFSSRKVKKKNKWEFNGLQR